MSSLDVLPFLRTNFQDIAGHTYGVLDLIFLKSKVYNINSDSLEYLQHWFKKLVLLDTQFTDSISVFHSNIFRSLYSGEKGRNVKSGGFSLFIPL